MDATTLAEEIRSECLGMRIGRLHRVVSRAYEQALQPLGLSLPQVEILTALTSRGPLRPADLARELLVERSTLSRNLALMQRKGWVSPAETSATGQSMSVTVAAPGLAVLGDARAAWQHAQKHLVTSLGPGALPTLDGWLDVLTAD